jgi:hypothetical protein
MKFYPWQIQARNIRTERNSWSARPCQTHKRRDSWELGWLGDFSSCRMHKCFLGRLVYHALLPSYPWYGWFLAAGSIFKYQTPFCLHVTSNNTPARISSNRIVIIQYLEYRYTSHSYIIVHCPSQNAAAYPYYLRGYLGVASMRFQTIHNLSPNRQRYISSWVPKKYVRASPPHWGDCTVPQSGRKGSICTRAFRLLSMFR